MSATPPDRRTAFPRLHAALFFVLTACGTPSSAPQDAPAAVVDPGAGVPLLLVPHTTGTVGDVAYVEFVTGGDQLSAADLPVVVALHGAGDTPLRFALLLQEAHVAARWILPQGPVPRGDGFAWFDAPLNRDDEALARHLSAQSERLSTFLTALDRPAPAAMLGWSQGGMVAGRYALSAPGEVPRVVLAGAWLPKRVTSAVPPEDLAQAAESIHWIHQSGDPVVSAALITDSADRVPGSHRHPSPGEAHLFTHDLVTQAVATMGLPLLDKIVLQEPDFAPPDGDPLDPSQTGPQPGPDGMPQGEPGTAPGGNDVP